MSSALTEKQKKFISIWCEFRIASGISPTNQQMKSWLGFKSHNAVPEYYRVLIGKKIFTKKSKIARGVTLTTIGAKMMGLDLNDLNMPLSDMDSTSFTNEENELVGLYQNLSGKNQEMMVNLIKQLQPITEGVAI